MKKLFFLLFLFSLSACSNYETKDLYGTWNSPEVGFVFNEDKTMDVRIGAMTDKGRYRPFGNTLELVNSENKVLTRVTIKSLKNDSLVIDMPNIGSRIFTLTRMK